MITNCNLRQRDFSLFVIGHNYLKREFFSAMLFKITYFIEHGLKFTMIFPKILGKFSLIELL